MQKKHILNLSKKAKLCLTISLVTASFAVVGVTAYLNAERLVSYEISQKSVISHDTVPVPFCDTVEEIPECTKYTMYLSDGKICVYSGDALLYAERFANTANLTPSDLTELEEDGISFAARPDVIEMLIYLNS